MKPLKRFMSRLYGALYGRDREADLAEELQLHIDMQTEDNIRAGMSPEEALRAARLKFGGMESVKETYRDQRGVPFLESLVADVRYGARQLRREPGFTFTAVIAIALGIGATTAVFSVINTILLKPLPIPEPDRLVFLATANEGKVDNTSASPTKFIHWQALSSVIEDVSAYVWTGMNYTGGSVVEFWNGQRVSANTFRAFRISVLQGRTFSDEEELPNGPRVAVISEGLWKRRFGTDPQVLGTTVSLSGEPYTVIGIVADSPGLLEMQATPTDVYVPFQIDPNTTDIANIFSVVARLKPGVTLEQATERVRASSEDYRARFPVALNATESFTVKPFIDGVLGDEDATDAVILLVAVNMVLLIACANVANLLLVRGTTRRREIGIRVAIGAGRGRVIRQLLTESVLLALAGGAVGLFVGDIGIRALVATNFRELPAFWQIHMDWRVVGFAFGASLLTALIFGLFPAFQGSRVDLNSTLKESGNRWGSGLKHNKIRSGLVISEVALAVVLLTASALLIRTFIAVNTVDRGFETRNVLLVHTSFTGTKYSTTARAAEAIRDGLSRVRALPGVLSAGAAAYPPLQGNMGLSFDVPGMPSDPFTGSAGWTPISPGYFETLNIPLKRGRLFNDRDDGKAAPVIIISEGMAKKFWGSRDPLNDRIQIAPRIRNQFEGEPVRQIIGIVGDIRQRSLEEAPTPRVYVPQAQLPQATNEWLLHLAPNAWLVRTQTETHELRTEIQEQLRQATGLPVVEVRSMNEIVSLSVEDRRFIMVVMVIFACAALLLAAIGIYGVMAYTVEQRTQEIGIRLALGATARQVRNMVVRSGMVLTLTGVVIGIGAALELARLMESLLFGVQPLDPIVFVTVPLLLTVVALLAVWLPALRASRVHPMDSLRHE